MSGDSKSGGSRNSKAAAGALPAAMAANMSIPAFMPGNQSALAQQLAMGFGGTPQSILQSPLMQLFQPMSLPNPAAGPILPPKATPAKPGDSGGSGGEERKGPTIVNGRVLSKTPLRIG